MDEFSARREQLNYEARLEDEFYRRQDGSTSMMLGRSDTGRRPAPEITNPKWDGGIDPAVFKMLTHDVVEEALNDKPF